MEDVPETLLGMKSEADVFKMTSYPENYTKLLTSHSLPKVGFMQIPH